MDKKILLIGGGGHCMSVLDSLQNREEYDTIGIIDVEKNVGSRLLGTPIIGTDDQILNFFKKGYKYAFVTLGSIGDSSLRVKLFKKLCEIGFIIPNIIDPTATISKYARIQKGVFIGKNAVVNSSVLIKDGVIINTSVTIEHECVIDEFSHVAPGTVLNGNVHINCNTHVGANSVVKQGVTIGSNVMIGMGSVVLKNISNDAVAYGNPCKEVKK